MLLLQMLLLMLLLMLINDVDADAVADADADSGLPVRASGAWWCACALQRLQSQARGKDCCKDAKSLHIGSCMRAK